jgi:hypothetical protein
MTITEAFKKYNAFLRNIDLSICAENSDGELVIRLWDHYFGESSDNFMLYKDHIASWPGPGNSELSSALDKAKEINQVIRAVVAHTENPKEVEAGQDANKFKNTYSVREDWTGSLEVWDGNNYEIKFATV